MNRNGMNAPKGEASWRAKLTERQVRQIHALVVEGRPQREIAAAYGISVGNIANASTWKHLGLARIVIDPAEAARRAAAAAGRTIRESSISPHTSYDDDPACQAIVEANPDGIDNADIAEHMGISRERVRQLVERALASLRARCVLAGITPEDLAAVLARRERVSPLQHAHEHFAEGNGFMSTTGNPVEDITDGPLIELDRLLSAVEERADFVADVTSAAERHT